jgi:hypothetical protein
LISICAGAVTTGTPLTIPSRYLTEGISATPVPGKAYPGPRWWIPVGKRQPGQPGTPDGWLNNRSGMLLRVMTSV